MKKMITYKIISLFVIASLAAGCNAFLDEVEPQGRELSEAYMNEENKAEKAVTAMYWMLSLNAGNGPDGNYVDNHYDLFLANTASDDADKGSQLNDLPELQTLNSYLFTAAADRVMRPFYVHGFWAVAIANYVLDNLETSPIDDYIKTRMQGEAHFFRAYYYFYLLKHFGGVPILTGIVKSEDFGNVPRATYSETFDFIIEEFKEAIRLLPPRSDYEAADLGRASRGSAQGMLARVMLYRIGTDPDAATKGTTWQALYDLTGEITGYSLMSNYAALFEEITDGNWREESLFEYTGKDGWMNSGKVLNWYFQACRGDWYGMGWGFNQPTQDLVDAFGGVGSADPRLSNTVFGIGINGSYLYGAQPPYNRGDDMMTNYYNRKAALQGGFNAMLNGTTKAMILIRYADILLMRAEAAYYIGNEQEARSLVNQIRQRARQSSYCMGWNNTTGFSQYPDATAVAAQLPDITATGTALLEAIWHERRLELAMEDFRTFDLVRTGRLLENVGKVKDDYRNPAHANYKNNGEVRIPGIRENIQRYCMHKTVNVPGTVPDRYIPTFPIPESEINYWNIDASIQ
ncbi:MAG: RagB/SusD family nutrient uptake outer membrane protein [Prevotellaceae bacterium]|jgi:hypothetical protein|nr:RagB/SusD family nutrient uptake outer membrane protein [Prevotellaceae bacterium]